MQECGYTNGEINAMVAPFVKMDSEDTAGVVFLVFAKDGMTLRSGTTLGDGSEDMIRAALETAFYSMAMGPGTDIN
jgi:hypothetical protein